MHAMHAPATTHAPPSLEEGLHPYQGQLHVPNNPQPVAQHAEVRARRSPEGACPQHQLQQGPGMCLLPGARCPSYVERLQPPAAVQPQASAPALWQSTAAQQPSTGENTTAHDQQHVPALVAQTAAPQPDGEPNLRPGAPPQLQGQVVNKSRKKGVIKYASRIVA